MDSIFRLVSSALTPVFGSICDMIKNMFMIQSNYEDLKGHMEYLLELKQLLDDDERRLHLPRTQVRDWLRRVENLESGFHSVQLTVTANGNTINGSCCLFSLDCKLSNNIIKGLVEVKRLIEEGRAFAVSVNPVPKPVEYIPAPSIEGQSTASRNLDSMMGLLRNDKFKRIGVYGMGGVGKTTLIKNLNNKLGEDPTNQTFSIVIWVVVSQNKSVKNVQSQIARRFELQIKMEESECDVASRLHNRLAKEKGFLLILDDVWEEINVDHVGIPRHENHTGRKIIITSRSLLVCRRMLTDFNFELACLSLEEARKLFSQQVGEEVVNDDEIKPWTVAVVKECNGLPLALITVGASMREERNIALWKFALEALQKSMPRIEGVEENVYKPLKLSYEFLKRECLKSCFFVSMLVS